MATPGHSWLYIEQAINSCMDTPSLVRQHCFCGLLKESSFSNMYCTCLQGSRKISVGATKQFGCSAQQALQECGRVVEDPSEVAKAEGLLRPSVHGLWGPSADWQVSIIYNLCDKLSNTPSERLMGSWTPEGKLSCWCHVNGCCCHFVPLRTLWLKCNLLCNRD